MVLQAIRYTPSPTTSSEVSTSSISIPPSLQILNQLDLPHNTSYISINSVSDAYNAIKSMAVRGAPAIAIVAALSVCVATHHSNLSPWPSSASEMQKTIAEMLHELGRSRPTAVNLMDAVRKLETVVERSVQEGQREANGVREVYIKAAEKMLVDDVQDNERIGQWGAKWIVERAGEKRVAVLTHCNTGYVFPLRQRVSTADLDPELL